MIDSVKSLDINNEHEIARSFSVLTYLRPHLNEVTFVARVRAQSLEGYKVVYIERDGQIAAAAGYRIATFLAWGKVLYIDDLITHPKQKRLGLGGALLEWLLQEGKRLGCDEVHLDTGFTRHDAHRLYLNKGFKLSCHHMSALINGGEP